MADLNPQPLYVATKTLYDIEAMQKVTAQVLDKLGCPGCHSGRVLDFIELEQFVVNPESLEVTEIRGGGF